MLVSIRLDAFVRRYRFAGKLTREQYRIWNRNASIRRRVAKWVCNRCGAADEDEVGALDWDAFADFLERMATLFVEHAPEILAFVIALIDAFSARGIEGDEAVAGENETLNYREADYRVSLANEDADGGFVLHLSPV